VNQLNRMIADLLDLSRLETKHLELRPREVEPAAMARVIVERLRKLVEPHVVELALDGELPPLHADPERVEQVLTNLVTNAARYGFPDTSITITVTRRDRELVWSVSNLGPGIPAAELPRLFQRFHRGERTRDGGLGLGLYIARGLVEAHGGHMWAESELDARTTFSFTTPVTGS
jgi:signal transduction histidine kinase